jgi:hypothetical protein
MGRGPSFFVCREAGDWQFLCGEIDHAGEVPRVVALGHFLDLSPELADLPEEWEAERDDISLPWIRRRIPRSQSS